MEAASWASFTRYENMLFICFPRSSFLHTNDPYLVFEVIFTSLTLYHHSTQFGYTRGLLKALDYPERQRLKSVATFAVVIPPIEATTCDSNCLSSFLLLFENLRVANHIQITIVIHSQRSTPTAKCLLFDGLMTKP